MADDIITSLEIIEKLLFPETDFWRNNNLNLKIKNLFLKMKFLIAIFSVSTLTNNAFQNSKQFFVKNLVQTELTNSFNIPFMKSQPHSFC